MKIKRPLSHNSIVTRVSKCIGDEIHLTPLAQCSPFSETLHKLSIRTFRTWELCLQYTDIRRCFISSQRKSNSFIANCNETRLIHALSDSFHYMPNCTCTQLQLKLHKGKINAICRWMRFERKYWNPSWAHFDVFKTWISLFFSFCAFISKFICLFAIRLRTQFSFQWMQWQSAKIWPMKLINNIYVVNRTRRNCIENAPQATNRRWESIQWIHFLHFIDFVMHLFHHFESILIIFKHQWASFDDAHSPHTCPRTDTTHAYRFCYYIQSVRLQAFDARKHEWSITRDVAQICPLANDARTRSEWFRPQMAIGIDKSMNWHLPKRPWLIVWWTEMNRKLDNDWFEHIRDHSRCLQ